MNILEQIVQTKQAEVAALFADRRDLVASLQQAEPLAIIAEYKRASPSSGAINLTATVEDVVRQYTAGGAAAFSILTDRSYFQGDLSYLRRARAVSSLPIIRKDFIIDPIQVYETALAGADALLLIARLLTPNQLAELTELAHSLHLQVLVEIHEAAELDKALACQPDLLGVNARNLQTMTTDVSRIKKIIAAVPADVLVVAESGVRSRADVVQLQQAGAAAILVGTQLMQASHQQTAVAALLA